MSMSNELTSREQEAIKACAAYFGRRWKSDLRDCWMRVDYPSSLDSGALQTLRNSESFGPSGLVRFKLSAFVASEVQA